jgi:hypothetical protein
MEILFYTCVYTYIPIYTITIKRFKKRDMKRVNHKEDM